ncbi:MAG TPA: FG-GAP-like repeat-containing protein [Calditrichia bacterium]|nr:FG-GAP-like repeat-containing protein [Calditrichia bacterium]
MFSIFTAIFRNRRAAILAIIAISPLVAQHFTRVTDSSNPIVSTAYNSNYTGAAWVDIDGDGDLDLSVTPVFIFRNNGGGNFERIPTAIGENFANTLGNGFSWGDYDNDGDPDCFLAGTPSALYRNDGNFLFTKITDGDLSENFRKDGWSCAWADANLDGFIDLVIANPNGFTPLAGPSHFFVNDGDGRLSREVRFEFTQLLAPYTVSTWNDFDLDGDPDLFIGSGPAGTAAVDYLYRNNRTVDSLNLDRLDLAPLSSDLQDGQVWNGIDFDNDRDVDLYLTNYAGAPDRFYRNDGGTYTSLTNIPLIHSESSLGNSWGDVDNDGDLDVVITNDGGITHFYRNDGGTFTPVSEAFSLSGSSRGASFGDYDNDGDLDLFIAGSASARGLFRNDLAAGNNWMIATLRGTLGNAGAIGARVEVLATINGNPTWQMREVSAQNGFNSHNSQRVHFGLGDATIADSLIIHWPGGQVSRLAAIPVNRFLFFTEDIPAGFLRANFRADLTETLNRDSLTVRFSDLSFSDPNSPIQSYQWDFDGDGQTDATVANPVFTFAGADTYSVSLTVSNGQGSDTRTRVDYIRVAGLFPEIVFDASIFALGTIPDTLASIDTTFWVYNRGLAADSITLSLDPGGVNPPAAVSANAGRYNLAPGDSLPVNFTLFPNQVIPEPGFVNCALVVNSRYSRIPTNLEKTIRFRIQVITAIEPGENNAITRFALAPNYPNPFNPSTSVRFQLPEASRVRLSIYSLLGEEVAVLAAGYRPAGRYRLTWDGRNREGAPVGSGIYFLRFSAVPEQGGHSFQQTRKMMLVK